jgi:hypothetical protein
MLVDTRAEHGPIACRLLLMSLLLVVTSCQQPRQFKNEQAVLDHFEQHRQQFETAGALYSRLGVPVFDVTKYQSRESQTNTQLVQIATEIGVTILSRV